MPLYDVFVDKFFAAKNDNLDDLIDLVEIIAGAAVLCENKAIFIPRMVSLGEFSSAFMQELIVSMMSKVTDIVEVEGSEESEDSVRSQELIKHLQEKNDKLVAEKDVLHKRCLILEQVNSSLEVEVTAFREKVNQNERENPEALSSTLVESLKVNQRNKDCSLCNLLLGRVGGCQKRS